jgi:hypothetical protein
MTTLGLTCSYVAPTPHTHLECRGLPYYQNTALYPVTELLQRALRRQPDDTLHEKLRKLETILSQYSLTLTEAVPLLASLVSLSLPDDRYPPLTFTPQRQRHKTLETLLAILLAEALAEAHTLVEQHEERLWEAEVHRLRGVLLLRQTGTPQEKAEACFLQAMDVARRQQAKSLELRAAMSLARLWQQRGKRAEARELLAPVYGWFTEGFDTADLQEAKALLTELG